MSKSRGTDCSVPAFDNQTKLIQTCTKHMNDTLSVTDIHRAMDARLKQARRSKVSLGNAVRKLCWHRPNNVSFEVGEHRLEWIEAECFVHGGRNHNLETGHSQRVLMLDGHLIDEPRVEVTYPDWTENDWDALWHGPINGWYHEGAWEIYEGSGDPPEGKPRPIKTCKLSSPKEVARALPAAMAAWYAQKLSEHDAQNAETDTLTDSLGADAAGTGA